MKKKWITFLAATMTAVMCLTACGGSKEAESTEDKESTTEEADSSEEASGEETTITIWCWDEYFNVAAMKTAAEIYNEEHPEVTFDIQDIALEDIEMKLHTNLVNGSVEGLADIVLIADMSYAKFLEAYSDSFLDTTDLFPYDEFAEGKLVFSEYEGSQYGVPFDSGVGGLFYRSDYFEEAGISADKLNDITYEEYIEIGKELKEKTGKALTVFDWSMQAGNMRDTMFMYAGIYDEDGNIYIKDNEAIREAFEISKELIDSGIVVETNGWEEMVAAINNGEVASYVSGAWFVGSIKAAEEQSGCWGVCSPPRLEAEGSVNAIDTTGCTWALFEGKENNDVAIDFLNELYAGNEEFYGSILVNQGAIGSWVPSYDIEEYETEDEFFGGQQVNKIFSDMIPEIKVGNLNGHYTEIANAIDQVLADYVDGNIDIDTAMQNTEDAFKSLVGE